MTSGHVEADRLAAEEFGRWVRRERTGRGWTQPQLLAEVERRGVRLDQSTLSKIENGHRASVGLGVALVVSAALGRRLKLLHGAPDGSRAGVSGRPSRSPAAQRMTT